MLTAIVGTNWGDEGKGRMVDLLSQDYEIVCRYQGGNNAGHTVINERGKFILNLLPSGILRDTTTNVMGAGMVVDLHHLCGELDALAEKSIDITPKHLKISDRAVICMPYHPMLDVLEEERLGAKRFGSTRRGIAPVYSDKYMKKVVRFGDLFSPRLKEIVTDLLEWKNLLITAYGHAPITVDEIMTYLEQYGNRLKPYVCDTTEFLTEAVGAGKNVMFEAQLGALRDIDYGICPYTSSSPTLAAYAPIGAGIPGARLDSVVGIMKAYSSCVGEGPFVCEMDGEEAHALREAGGEYGAATGRPRRVGGFDVVASRYGAQMQGCTEIALTKLDVLSYMERIPVVTAYEIDGVKTTHFPYGDALLRAKPVIEYLPGFQCDISDAHTPDSLPENALRYVRYIESAVGCKIRYVSCGAERDRYIDFGA